jgi:hypothetical protein
MFIFPYFIVKLFFDRGLKIISLDYIYFFSEFEKMRSEVSTTTHTNFMSSEMFNLFQNLNCN